MIIEKEKIDMQKFKDGLYDLNTRRFGKVAELMIQQLYDMEKSKDNSYDLLSKEKEKIEVKFSRVLKTCSKRITKENVLNQILISSLEQRKLTYEEAKTANFDCNIQQIKSKEFQYLYYGCFFQDKILICKMSKEDVLGDPNLRYSNHQHRGNVGEGQFHINEDNLDYHIKNYFVRFLSYEEFIALFEKDR